MLRYFVATTLTLALVLLVATFALELVNLLRTGAILAAIDDLNQDVVALGQSVVALQDEVASLQPAAPVDLSQATAGVVAAKAAVDQAVADLKTKFPPAQ